MSNVGKLFIVAAPSGGGKTSLVRQLAASLTDLEVSISHTTRSKRPGELDGVDYFFVSDTTFKTMKSRGEFLEHARVFDHFYGTSFAEIDSRLKNGIDVLLDIDWQGARQIKEIFTTAVGIFIVPPSLTILKTRLQSRKQDNELTIQSRMSSAQTELSHYAEFDYLVLNDNFDHALDDLKAIIRSQRLLKERQVSVHHELLSMLLEKP